ncbi:ROK family transcriptional regulator [Psychromicrobium xiongbiense]|uniref:ROK family transcriptional regulator n=1 Tax=Psychromicrobium xiongbiense TaxID=3051184 RepID=UPI0025551140|nr:ROK family transcriptional regulator [Psychromicrobium sp. YIM S02556]
MASEPRPVSGAPRNPGSQSALRQQNQRRIVQALSSVGPLTQAELSRHTGLSTATVSNLVRIMSDDGLVTTAPTTSSGRRATSVQLNSEGAVAVGIDVGRSHVRVVLASLDYRVVAEGAARLPLGHRAEEGVQAATSLLTGLLAETGLPPSAVIGAGVGIPGPIDSRSGAVIQGAILPEWVGIKILDMLQNALQVPAYVDNDANLGALAQITWGEHTAVQNLVFIKIGSGIGSGLILDGSLFYGAIGVTGEIGHTIIAEHGLVCRCGNRGCLETMASTTTMMELLARRNPAPATVDDILRLAHEGDPATLRVVDDAGLAVGRAAAVVANLLNPEVIVIGGPLAGLGDLLLDPVRRGLLRHVVPAVGATTEVVMSSLGNRAEALGAAALVLQHQGIPTLLNRGLGARTG